MLLIVEWHVTAIVHGSSFLLEIVLKCVEFLTFSLPLDTNSHHWCCCCYTKVWGIPNLVSYKYLASFPGLPTVQFWSLAVRKNEDGFFHIMSTWVERGGGGPPIHVSIMFVSSYTHILCPKQQMVSFQLHNCFAWPTLLQFQHAVLGETLHNGLIFPPSSCRWLTVHKTEMEGLEDHVICKIKSA